MAIATSYEVSTIKPAGGGDYTALAAWWAAKKGGGGGGNVAAWAECYSGGDMGIVDLTNEGYTPTADFYTRIYAAPGEWQDGSYSTTQGARVEAVNVNGIRVQVAWTRIEGIRFVISETDGSGTLGVYIPADNVLIDGNCFVITGVTTDYAVRGCLGRATDITLSQTIRNNIIYGNNTAKRTSGIELRVFSPNANATGNFTLQNNSISQITIAPTFGQEASGGFIHRVYAPAGKIATLNAILINNTCTGNDTDYQELKWGDVGTEDINITQTYSLSEDDTADDWGGAGNRINKAGSDVFENVASDLNLKAGGPARDVAISLIDTFETDAILKTRKNIPDGNVGWDMGALTTALVCEAGGGPLINGRLVA